jgi:uncharacterized circularly permuted ATP-grasp superfamily protein/uncharacterized alpha-E superfamily protein
VTSTLPPRAPHYTPLPGLYDEMLDAQGNPRPHWEHLARAFAELGTEELYRREAEAARLLAQSGVVYNAYRDQADFGRSWRLDPLPTVLPSREWEAIERGVAERAELLSLVLEDLYGPRELIARGLIPPEVVYGSRGFLRACDGIRLPGPQQLFNYAVDLGRDRDGRSIVIADHTQAPSGVGYALENRNVISKVLPSLYRDAQVHRLAPFFRALRAALQQAAPMTVEDPRIVVLTPGPRSETAFEHASLAATLGYPLVQGSDLTVRGERVWMRSVGQFEPVDVILRRVDGWFCDPLELRPDSQLGVPGLLEMVRAGAVTVVNPIGASVLESPALMAFLPVIGEHLLGREPQLRSATTWWCGDAESCRHVLSNLDQLVLRPAARGDERGGAALLGWELSDSELDELRRRIEHAPGRWVAQERVTMASMPVLGEDGALDSRRSVLRAFAVVRRDSYVILPGGLTRVQGAGSSRITNHAGALTKDTWVIASEPEPLTSFWLQSGPAVKGLDPMSSIPSGTAENLWWLGRYAERTEALTRLLRAVVDRSNELGGATNPAGDAALDALQHALIATADSSATLAAPLRAVLDNAYAVRDQLSRDTWLVIGPLERTLAELDAPLDGDPQAHSQDALQRVMQSLLALGGLGIESMVRDVGWCFLDAGRRLERGLQLLTLIESTLLRTRGKATDSLVLESVLGAAESIITYRFRYRSHAQLETVLELLLLDRGNPRSLAYQLDRLTEDFDALPRADERRLREDQRLTLEAYTTVHLADPAELARETAGGRRPALESLLERLLELLLRTGGAVDSSHFPHTAPTFSLLGPAGTEPSIVQGR